ncbi:MAG: hypothetical protein MUF42_07345 [Cytophagaceae bacterium]|jgi:hypothetical protein|nr:hypothetical protein [Cytophagaceae bacterium]
MNANPYPKVILALTIIFLILAAYSFYPGDVKVATLKLKKTELREYLSPASDSTLGPAGDSLQSVGTAKATANTNTDGPRILPKDSTYKPERRSMDTTRQTFLFIGDSMLEGLRRRMYDYCKENGDTMVTVIWYSSSSLWYGNSDTLSYFIKKYKPTYVLLCLGANELFIRDIKKDRASLVANIVRQMGDLPYVWIGPPNWKPDTGINDLIVSYAGSDHYFESKKLTYARSRDGAHPTLASARIWMDSVASYIVHKSCCPVKLNRPARFYKGLPATVILQPNPPPGL